MNKKEWDAMDSGAKDQVVWDHFPDIGPTSDDWVLSEDGGATGFDFYETEDEANEALFDVHPEIEVTVVHWRHCHNFTTDRNACALVLDEIENRKLWRELVAELPLELWNRIDSKVFVAMTLPPDLICYCAVRAVENENA